MWPRTARVDSSYDFAPTLSEGQGYGIAISAAIGDKETLKRVLLVALRDNQYYQESLAVYQLLFLTGNFPRPFSN